MSAGKSIRCWQDKTSELATYGDHWIEGGDFPLLDKVKILYTWVQPSRLDSNGMEVSGQARRLPNNTRDVFGYDFLIEISADWWAELSEEERARLVWHELNHCCVKIDPEGNVSQDSHGRVKIYTKKHDVCFNTFSEELSMFGLSKGEQSLVKGLVKTIQKQKAVEKVTTEVDRTI